MTIELFVSNKSYSYSQARRHERLPADFEVHVRDDSLRVGDRCADISEAGIGVATPRPLPPMTLVSLRIHADAGEDIDVLGRVMWTAPNRMGVRFEQADQRVTDLVARLRSNYQRI
jgi:hypothetical protein